MTNKKYIPLSSSSEVVEAFPHRLRYSPSIHEEAAIWLEQEFGPSAWTGGADMPFEIFMSFQTRERKPLIFLDIDRTWFTYQHNARFKKAENAILFKLRWL